GLREGHVALMVHSGSVAIGHLAGLIARAELERIHPPTLKRPPAFTLPLDADSHALDAIHNAANFAFANRMFLALIALNELQAACGEFDAHLVYDAPHNMAWQEPDGRVIHRKGACPARGPADMTGTPFAQTGEPVLLPGSMGAPSYLLAGLGNLESLKSASHGAGRALSRGDALKAADEPFHAFLSRFRVVTPVDFNRQDIKQRRDIVTKKMEDIKKEAPHAYKDIGAVMRTLTVAGMARPIAQFWPLMTVKG
ncbi:MAG: RtcB family protein, partial [Planctomycetes bacterium]|nr:RtcB family protein [Planctomycetota bacterium]